MGAAAIPAMISAGGAILGGVLSNKGSKQSGVTNVTQTNTPWIGAQTPMYEGFQRAQNIINQQSPNATADLFRQRGLAGSPVNQAAQNLATNTINGNYLNSNPFSSGTVQDAMNMARSQINSQFGLNNYGSSAHQEWLGRGLMNAALPYLSQNYENERGRQYAAMAQAPALANTDYQDLGALQQADFMPWDFLGRYTQNIAALTPGSPGMSTTSQPYFSNPYSGAIGGALLANQLYNQYQTPSSGLAGMSSTNFNPYSPYPDL